MARRLAAVVPRLVLGTVILCAITAGTDVQVRAYTRKDGTYVPAHTRAAPGRGKNRK